MNRGIIVGISTVIAAVCLSLIPAGEEAQAGWRHRCGGRAWGRCAGWRHRCHGAYQAACCGVAAAPVSQGCCYVDGAMYDGGQQYHDHGQQGQYPPPAPDQDATPPAPQGGEQGGPPPAPEA